MNPEFDVEECDVCHRLGPPELGGWHKDDCPREVSPRGNAKVLAEMDARAAASASRLVRAAPQLLEMLKAHLFWYEGRIDVDEKALIQRTRDVIAKAEG